MHSNDGAHTWWRHHVNKGLHYPHYSCKVNIYVLYISYTYILEHLCHEKQHLCHEKQQYNKHCSGNAGLMQPSLFSVYSCKKKDRQKK